MLYRFSVLRSLYKYDVVYNVAMLLKQTEHLIYCSLHFFV